LRVLFFAPPLTKRLRLGAALTTAAWAFYLGFATPALAATPTGPPDGSVFREGESVEASWSLDPDPPTSERSFSIEWSKSPSLDADGSFTHSFLDFDFLEPDQRTYVFTSPGRYYWHIESSVCTRPPDQFGFCSRNYVYGPTAFFGILDVISVQEAERYTRRAIERQTGPYIDIYQLRCRRKGDFKARCTFLAGAGDVSYRGKGSIRYSRNIDKNSKYFYYRFRVLFTNHYCLSQGGTQAECTDIRHW
jgi:hypothetical protein